MLQTLNRKIQGLLSWIIIGVIAITFTLFGIDYFFVNRHVDDNVATVNGSPISKQMLQLAYRRFQRTTPQQESVDESRIKKHLLQQLVRTTVLTQAAKQQGFALDNTQVAAAIGHIPAFFVDGHFSEERYTQALNGAFYTPQTFEQTVRDDLLMNQQHFAWVASAFVDQNELEHYVQLEKQTRSYAYTMIPATDFLKNVSVTPQEIETYDRQHPNEFLSPERVRIEFVCLSKKQIRQSVHVTDAQVHQYWIESKGTLSDKQKTREVNDAPKIREQLLLERTEKLYTHQLELLTDLSYQESETLSAVAQALHQAIHVTPFFSRQGGEDALSKNPAVVKAAFSHDVLKFGNNSAPITLNDDEVCVIRKQDHRPAARLPLRDIHAKIEFQLKQAKAQGLAQTAAKTLSQPTLRRDSKSPTWVWKESKHALRTSNQPSTLINQIAFNLQKVGDRQFATLPNGDTVVVQLKGLIMGAWDKLSQAEQKTIRAQFESIRGELDYAAYVHDLMHEASIK